jgi:long-chain fatty acid transport protein
MRRKMKKKSRTAVKTVMWGLVFLTAIAVAQRARASGFDNNTIGIRGYSMASAYHGIADDASAIYYNPAGLSLIDEGELNVEAYTVFMFTKFAYTNTTSMPQTPETTVENESTEIPIIPGGFVSYSFDRWGLGIGVYAPYGGGGVVYKDFMGGDSLEASAGLFALSASVAVEIVKKYLAVGLTPTVYIGSMANKVTSASPDDPTGQTMLRVETDNSGYAGFGGSLGLMSKPIPELGIGVTVRSPVKVSLDGTNKVTVLGAGMDPIEMDSEVEFLLPMELTLGLGWAPIPQLTLGLSGTLLFHGMMEDITIKPEQGDDQVTKTHYHHNVRIALGAEYMFIKQLGVRAGFQFTQSPSEEEGLQPTSCDVSNIVPSLGLTWNIVDFLALDVTGFYVAGFEAERKSETEVQPGVSLSMTEKFDQDHWLLSAGLRFNWDFKP